jgi:hypothetical protein
VGVALFAPEPDMALVDEQRRQCEANDPPAEMLGLVTEQLGPASSESPATTAPVTTSSGDGG